jgi:sugar lactone lactonase YvrE
MARLSAPAGLAIDPSRNWLYIADRGNHRLRYIDLATGVIATLAGTGSTGTTAPYGDGMPANAAQLSSPSSVTVDAAGLVYVSDNGHGRIRVVDPDGGQINAWAGTTGCTTAPVVLVVVLPRM